MTPTRLFRYVAVAEAVTWGLLLLGMFLKYVTETTELGVRVFGMMHGVAFIAYVLATCVLWVDRRWSMRVAAIGMICAIIPFATVPFDLYVDRTDRLGDRFRLTDERPTTAGERLVAWLLAHPTRGLLVGLGAVAVLTTVALVVGPPASN